MKPPTPQFVGERHTARTLALQVLLDGHRHDAFVQELLDRHLARHALSAADRRLATQLVYGILRRRGTLFALLQPLVSRPPDKVEPWLWDTLCLGAYQLALLTHIPAHAALNETVELAAQFGRPGAKGFLNGILRALVPLLTETRTATPAANALPLEAGEYRVLARPVLPDPAIDPLEYLAVGFGLPPWLARRWLPRYGLEECHRLGFWFAGPAPLTLRCNPLRIERDALLAACNQARVAAEAGLHPQGVRVLDAVPVRDVPGYEQGWFAVQDESSMTVASVLDPRPGETVLDLCAAPGGKTTHLAELMQDRGRIVACDVDAARLQLVDSLARRLGHSIVETRRLDPDRGEEILGVFDRVLVDVPCSNTGVMGRRPEVRWRLRPEDLRHLVPLQVRLLRRAATCLRPGGVVVYSTCSIEPEENREVVRRVQAVLPALVLEAEGEAVPGRPADGGYWARLRNAAGS
jgi:16S rRNA (cytosine967-C5)-methyltransferase